MGTLPPSMPRISHLEELKQSATAFKTAVKNREAIPPTAPLPIVNSSRKLNLLSLLKSRQRVRAEIELDNYLSGDMI